MDMLIINLQLFANEVQTTLLSGLSAEMKTFYDMRRRPTWYTTSLARSGPFRPMAAKPSNSGSSRRWPRL